MSDCFKTSNNKHLDALQEWRMVDISQTVTKLSY